VHHVSNEHHPTVAFCDFEAILLIYLLTYLLSHTNIWNMAHKRYRGSTGWLVHSVALC